jgi:hypothetical protein
MTPREYSRESEAARERMREDADRDVVLAWRIGSFAAQAVFGKLPRLDVALAQSRGESGQQTVEQQLAQLTTISKSLGLPMRVASPETLAKLRPMMES